MRKNILSKGITAVFVSSILFGCSQEFTGEMMPETVNCQESIKNLSQNRTYEEALVIAQDAIGMLGENCATRSGRPRSISADDVQYIVSTSSTRSTNTPDTLMYVFNYEDNAGFAVVAANRTAEGLIAVTEQGNYIVGEESENAGFNLYMDMAEAYLLGFDDRVEIDTTTGFDVIMEYRGETIRDTLADYGPYLSVQWGQGDPYNLYAYTDDGYRIWAGCLATAAAQIMSFYEEPKQMQLTYDGSNYMKSLDWTSIKRHYSKNNCRSCGQHATIGYLFRQLGEDLQLSYTLEDKSSGTTNYIKSTFEKYGYSIGSKRAYSLGAVVNSLANSQLVYMVGLDQYGDGHAWVLDGYRKIKITRTEWTRPAGTLLWKVMSHTEHETEVTHINWGWDGDANGYFTVNVFKPVYKGTQHNYREDLEIFPYIQH